MMCIGAASTFAANASVILKFVLTCMAVGEFATAGFDPIPSGCQLPAALKKIKRFYTIEFVGCTDRGKGCESTDTAALLVDDAPS